MAGAVRSLNLDTVLVRVKDEESIDAADFVFEVPGDGEAGGGVFFGGGVDIGDPKAEMAGAGLLGGADDEVEIDVADAVPAAGEIETFWAGSFDEAQEIAVKAPGSGEVGHVNLHVIDANGLRFSHYGEVYPSGNTSAMRAQKRLRRAHPDEFVIFLLRSPRSLA